MPEAREGLKLRASLVEHAESLKAMAATRAGLNVDNATFVGIHNRRTDYLEYMETKYGEKTQFNRLEARAPMDGWTHLPFLCLVTN